MLDRLTLFELIGRRLDYTDQRQVVLARNMANADTPGFVPSDVVEPDFRRVLAGAGGARLQLSSTHAAHQAPLVRGGDWREEDSPHDIKPSGNAVSLEVEAAKLRSNSGAHKLATMIYGKYVKLLNAALGQN